MLDFDDKAPSSATASDEPKASEQMYISGHASYTLGQPSTGTTTICVLEDDGTSAGNCADVNDPPQLATRGLTKCVPSSLSAGSTLFMSSEPGFNNDNPTDLDNLSDLEKRRSIMLNFE